MKLLLTLLLAGISLALAAGRYFVPPVDDAAFWSSHRNPGGYLGSVVERARKTCRDGIPPIPRAEDYTRKSHERWANGTYEAQFNAFHNALRDVLYAYCLTGDRDTFLPVLHSMLAAACDMRCWTVPAHDPELATFHGKAFRLELYSTTFAGTLGSAAYLLKPVLEPQLHTRLTGEIDRRILTPFEAQLARPKNRRDGWLDQPGNWNAVCLAGISIAAATTVEDAPRRNALLDAAAEICNSYLAGFTADGYTSEGVDYWNYGFGYFLQLAELLRGNSDGKTELFAIPRARAAASFPDAIRISETLYPAYSDAMIYSRCSPQLIAWRDAQLGRFAAAAPRSLKILQGHLIVTPDGKPDVPPLASRSSYPDAGVYNFRPGQSGSRLALSSKGGHNNEGHNHNDVGSYIVVLDGTLPMVCDPGAEVYNMRTFSKQRYESKLLNSYGHSVPVVAGALQSVGKDARGVLLAEESGDDRERLSWNLALAYPEAKSLRKLTREIEYLRTGSGAISVTDAVEFAEPCTFETAVISPGTIRGEGNSWVIEYRGKRLPLRIRGAGSAIQCSVEEIGEKSRSKETIRRLSIRFAEPVKSGEIRVDFLPDHL